MIEVKNLTKSYGSKKAVDNISFAVGEGEILGFLGPNGAGKSTTMNIITGYSSATEGTVTIGGHEIFEEPLKAKRQLGYLPEQPPLYLDMRVDEYLSFLFDLKKVRLPRKKHIADVCELVKISDVSHRMIRNLSKGYRQRVGLAQALLGNPSVLILDEPTVGLDPKQIIEIRELIKSLGKDYTIILSSHILSEVQATCERVIVLSRGKIIADGTADSLSKAMSGDHRLTLRVEGPEAQVAELLEKLPGMVRVDRLGQKEGKSFDFLLESEPETDLRREIFSRLAQRNWPILGLRGSDLTLEDVFLRLTSDEGVEELHSAAQEAPPPFDEPNPEADSETTADAHAQQSDLGGDGE